MLRRKKFKLCLHKRKRRTQLVRGISRELSLSGKSLIKTVKHPIERLDKLSQFRRNFFGYLHIRQIVRLNLLNPSGKSTQRLQRMPA